MKRLFLILLLTFIIPSVTFASPAKEKSKKELANEEKERAKAKKAAIRKLKTLLTMTYRNWYWDGDIFYDSVNEGSSITLISGDYFFLLLTLILRNNDERATRLSVKLPESYLPNYEGKKIGEKTLKIEGRFEGGEKFEATVYSENNPHQWYFRSKEIKNMQGKPINILESLFSSNKLHIRFQTNESSRYKGRYESVSFDISGAKEVYDAAKATLIN